MTVRREFDADESLRRDVSSTEIRIRDPICPRCGRHRATECHHRKQRSLGGLDTWDNQVGLCWRCHNEVDSAPDANIELSHRLGWLVHSWDEPSTVPIINFHGRGRVLLTTDGQVVEVSNVRATTSDGDVWERRDGCWVLLDGTAEVYRISTQLLDIARENETTHDLVALEASRRGLVIPAFVWEDEPA